MTKESGKKGNEQVTVLDEDLGGSRASEGRNLERSAM